MQNQNAKLEHQFNTNCSEFRLHKFYTLLTALALSSGAPRIFFRQGWSLLTISLPSLQRLFGVLGEDELLQLFESDEATYLKKWWSGINSIISPLSY